MKELAQLIAVSLFALVLLALGEYKLYLEAKENERLADGAPTRKE